MTSLSWHDINRPYWELIQIYWLGQKAMRTLFLALLVTALAAAAPVFAQPKPPQKPQPPPQLSPTVQKLMQKAQSGHALTPAEMLLLQQEITAIQQRAAQSTSPAPKPATSGKNDDNRMKCLVRIGYKWTVQGSVEGSDCKDEKPEKWQHKLEARGHWEAPGRLLRTRPGGLMGEDIVHIILNNPAKGNGSTQTTGGKSGGHRGDSSRTEWNLNRVTGFMVLRAFKSRGDNMACELNFMPGGTATHTEHDACEEKDETPKPMACLEPLGMMNVFFPSYAKEQFVFLRQQAIDVANPANLAAMQKLAKQYGQKIPAIPKAQVPTLGQVETAWKDWNQKRLCDIGLSRDAFKRGFASGQPFRVTGRAKGTQKGPNGETIYGDIAVTVIVGDIPPLELVIKPQNYENWKPQGGANEKTAGNTLPIVASLQTKDGAKPPADIKARRFTFELLETSQEPGVCLNRPIKNATKDDDLKFEAAQPAGARAINGKIVEINQPATDATAILSCFDYGAWGKIKVTAELEDGQQMTGYLVGKKGTTEILLPKRDKNSKVADFFKQNVTGADTIDDETQKPRNTHNGDGLTLYEEYRGVIAKGEHKRLDPQKKDLVIENKFGDAATAAMKLFQDQSGINTIELAPDELPKDRLVNLNKGTAHGGDQYGLRLEHDGAVEDPSVAIARHANGGGTVPRSPKECAFIGVRCDMKGQDPGSASLLAHEIAHGCGVKHHGDKGYAIWPVQFYTVPLPPAPATPGGNPNTQPGNTLGGATPAPPQPLPCAGPAAPAAPAVPTAPSTTSPAPGGYPPGTLVLIVKATDTNVKVYDSTGQELKNRPYTLTGEVGIRGSKSSGDDNCIMFYYSYYQWAYHQDGGQHSFWAMNPHAPGQTFCQSASGTGINAAGNKPISYFSDAENGNCMKQFQVKDW